MRMRLPLLSNMPILRTLSPPRWKTGRCLKIKITYQNPRPKERDHMKQDEVPRDGKSHTDHGHGHYYNLQPVGKQGGHKPIDRDRTGMDHSKMDHFGMEHSHMRHMGGSRPMLATVLIVVSHCGAGCVLGDFVGEWLVYGTKATINGHDIWVMLPVDYGFALLFGIIFQYFSIAPMSGDYGPKSLVRAVKADVLSLTAFQIGLFGWMIIYQVGIWNYTLEMTIATYWWQMQVGMVLGFFTAIPVNWWLISKNIKEPCA